MFESFYLEVHWKWGMIFPKIALTLCKFYSDNYSEVKSCKLINIKPKQQIFINTFSFSTANGGS